MVSHYLKLVTVIKGLNRYNKVVKSSSLPKRKKNISDNGSPCTYMWLEYHPIVISFEAKVGIKNPQAHVCSMWSVSL